MRLIRTVLFFAAAAAAGCAAVREAREAQREVAARVDGSDAAEPVVFREHRLSELVGFALTNRPSVAQARLKLEDAELKLRLVAADSPLLSTNGFYQSLTASLTGGHAESSRGTHWDDAEFKTDGKASAALSLNLLVYDFGRYEAEAAAQAHRVVAAERDLANECEGVFYDVASTYFDLLTKLALLEVARTNVYEYSVHLDHTQSLCDAGEKRNLDLLKAKLDLSKSVEKLISASNDVLVAGVDLMSALGLEVSRGSPEELTRIGTRALSFTLREFPDTTTSAREIYALALTNAPAIRVAHAELAATVREVDYAVSDLLPKVTATASFDWSDPLWVFKWGFSGAQTLVNWTKTVNIERAVVAMRSAAANVDAVEQDYSSNVALAVATRDNAREALRSALVAYEQASVNLETVREQFTVGDASRVDYTDAVADYVTELGNCVKAFYTGQLAEAGIYRLTGVAPVYASK